LRSIASHSYLVWYMRRLSHLTFTLAVACSLLGFAAHNTAVASPSAAGDLVSAELVSEDGSIQPGRPFWVGVRLQMAKGWHVNWLNPGDAGFPPAIEWKLPDGFEAEGVQWPYPGRFDSAGLSIFGYEDEVLLLARIAPPKSLRARGDVDLEARVDWLACKDSCIPGSTNLKLRMRVLDGPPEEDSRWQAAFNRVREALPATPRGWGFAANITSERVILDMSPPDNLGQALSGVIFFPANEGVIENASLQTLQENGDGYRLFIELARMRAGEPKRIAGVLVSTNGWGSATGKAIVIDIPVE
jgi:thiol:disulfide interchange protein DsbD